MKNKMKANDAIRKIGLLVTALETSEDETRGETTTVSKQALDALVNFIYDLEVKP